MSVFHVSEEANIELFKPRTPTREDLDKNIELVWAVNEERLVNFLTPRDCPRVTFYVRKESRKEDIKKYIGKNNVHAVMAIEQCWFERILNTTLFLYEFDSKSFILQDEVAGYYVSTKTEMPIRVSRIDNLFSELFNRNVEVRIVPNLWGLHDEITASSLGYSMCRMKNALPRVKW